MLGFHRSTNPLDLLIGMWYRVTPHPLEAWIAEPREKSFIVVEQPAIRLDSGNYCVYATAKRGLPSPEAAKLLARLVGAPWASIAGLKDAEATTLQYICLPCPEEPPETVRVEGRLWARLIGRTNQCPRRGAVRGNCFTVILEAREPEKLLETLERLDGRLLPAYYSYQRFGTRRPNTHTVGLLALQGRLGEALEELLTTLYPDESQETLDCRKRRWQGDCSSKRFYEARVAAAARDQGVEAALEKLPSHVRQLLAGAVQAYIYNLYISLRIEHGHPLDRRLPGERRAANRLPLAPVPGVGYKTRAWGEAGRLLREAISLAGLEPGELEKPPHPRLPGRAKPYWRPVATKPHNLKATILAQSRVALRFCMEKGMYATLLLREIARITP